MAWEPPAPGASAVSVSASGIWKSKNTSGMQVEGIGKTNRIDVQLTFDAKHKTLKFERRSGLGTESVAGVPDVCRVPI
jgi:hypothetical protein